MKIILIGASGTLGKAVFENLKQRHEVICASKTKGEIQVDLNSEASIEELFKQVGPFDALVCTAGLVHFAPLDKMTSALYEIGLQNKLMGQVNTVLIGQKYINKGGSFTLTSGILAHDPIRSASSAAMVNGALEAFVKAAAIELGNDMRINAICPTIVNESVPKFGSLFQGFESIPASRAALAYSKSVEGAQTGQVYRVI